MLQTATARRPLVVAAIQVLVVFDAVALLFAGIVHLAGAQIPLGFATFDEPPILPAGIVESLAGLIFVAAVYAIFARRAWAWGVTLAAHLFAIAGFLVGIYATRNGTTTFNHIYHWVMLAVFVVGLVLVLLPADRATLGKGGDGSQPE